MNIFQNQLLTPTTNSFNKDRNFNIQIQSSLDVPSILKLDLSNRPEETFCATFYKSFLFFDYVLTDLESEFQERKNRQLFFTEEEIWKLCEGSISGLSYLYNNNIEHGSLKLETIYVNQKGIIKVADPPLFSYADNYDNIFTDRDEFSSIILISPELLNALDKNIRNPIYDKQKSDVFTLGMIFLQIGSMSLSNTCYNYDQAIMFDDKLENNLASIKVKYHDSFYYLVKEMLTVSESQRPNFQQLSEKLDRIPKAKQAMSNLTETIIAPQKQNQTYAEPDYSNPIHSIYADQYKSVVSPQQKFPDYSNYDNQAGGGLDQTYGAVLDYNNPQYGSNPLMNNFDILGPSMYGVASQMDINKDKNQLLIVKEKYPNGSKYQGQKKGVLKHGKGRFIHEDGSYYDGNWKDNKMSGKGILYDQNGKVLYDGTFKEDQYHGHGTSYNLQAIPIIADVNTKNLQDIDQNWTKFDGDFKNDKRDGFGTLILINGDKYVGAFKNNQIHGHGNYMKKNGQKIQGIWNQGIMK